MMVVAASRLLQNGEMALVGTGIPLVGAMLAKHTHAPEMVLVMEAVAFDSRPLALPFCVADPRGVYRTPWTPTAVEVMGQLLQNRRIDVGFLGGAQVDKYGNINSTCMGPYLRPHKRFEGSGGAMDIAAMAGRTIIIMIHEQRRFVEQVDYITSPGWKCRDYRTGKLIDRRELGMWGGPYAVVSTMGVMKFDDGTHEMYLAEYFEDLGITPQVVRENTGFTIDVSRAKPAAPPLLEELHVLRTVVDPEGIYMKY
ncbi:hypothetical protein SY88_09930 [Clostridiales bacterium PH28_bin88]|nr:hypothetical protein SY88_09930 [Clostridiales bacterium PH28_bin88]